MSEIELNKKLSYIVDRLDHIEENLDTLMSAEVWASKRGVSVETVRRACREGKVAGVKILGHWHIDLTEQKKRYGNS